jgi:hypothetical protein
MEFEANFTTHLLSTLTIYINSSEMAVSYHKIGLC